MLDRSSRSPELSAGEAGRRFRRRAVLASMIAVMMLALPWIAVVATGPVAETVIGAIPLQLACFIAYGVISAGALWAIFALLWPATDQ
ncbi:hypothetical protein [Phytoactinopolyspora limicola]|uniref:hypothetical protein n=1 Tax=Phytoactinopolyspora limicola TaxID=2715536 RepID=UPI00140C5B8A|nr:hypothetical protein [Phytoactinopolyspora limicola]